MTTSEYFMLTALDNQSDEEVLWAWRNGQVQGLEVLFQRYGMKVYSLAYKMLADTEDAEAMTQEVFASLGQPHGWQLGQGVYSFLMTLTRSRCLAKIEGRGWTYAIAHHLRGLFSWRKSKVSVIAPQFMVNEWSGEQADEAVQADHLLSTLSHKERDILGLAYYETANPKLLAKRLHIPLKIAQHRSRKALVKLHDTAHNVSRDEFNGVVERRAPYNTP